MSSVENKLLEFIHEHFPDDAVVGEEHGKQSGTSGYVWHLDPIDATEIAKNGIFSAINFTENFLLRKRSIANNVSGKTTAAGFDANERISHRILNRYE